MKTDELLLKLSKKYPSPQYAFLSQVRNQTGYSSSVGTVRTADALALGLWASRGHYLHGFELKVSRSDWLHELKNPAKAEAIEKYCDMFSLVIPDLKIIDISEVPKTWGIMLATGRGMKTVREAPLTKAKPMEKAFLCGFLRKVTEQIERTYTPTIEVEKIIKERVESQLDYKVQNAVTNGGKYEELCEKIRKYEEASGIPVTKLFWSWDKPEKIGEAVKVVLDGSHERLMQDLDRIKKSAERIAESAGEEIKSLKISPKEAGK